MKRPHKLIAKDIFKCLNPEEARELDAWRITMHISDDEYERMKHCIVNGQLSDGSTYHVRERHLWRRNLLRYAAILLLPLLGGFAYWFLMDAPVMPPKEASMAMDMKIERKQPMLILSDGQIRNLSRNDNSETIARGILNTGDALVCNKTEDEEFVSGEPEFNTIVVPQAGEFQLTLADGTQVWLNENTRLQFPAIFAGKNREIVLMEGEIYLEVAKNSELPFIVRTTNGSVKVLGTHFNVRAESPKRVITTLAEGCVEVSLNGQQVMLHPGQQAVVENEILSTEVDIEEFICWKDNLFYFKDQSLATIVDKLAKWYGFQVVWEDSTLCNTRYFVWIDKYSSVNEILDRLAEAGNVNFRIQGTTVFVCK